MFIWKKKIISTLLSSRSFRSPPTLAGSSLFPSFLNPQQQGLGDNSAKLTQSLPGETQNQHGCPLHLLPASTLHSLPAPFTCRPPMFKLYHQQRPALFLIILATSLCFHPYTVFNYSTSHCPWLSTVLPQLRLEPTPFHSLILEAFLISEQPLNSSQWSSSGVYGPFKIHTAASVYTVSPLAANRDIWAVYQCTPTRHDRL